MSEHQDQPTTATAGLVFAHNSTAGGFEPTSSMCRRVTGCLAGVNGDFFANGEAVGGAISRCLLLHTPQVPHELAFLNSSNTAHNFYWSAKLVDASGKPTAVTAMNTSVGHPSLTAYSSRFGRLTRAGAGIIDLIFTSPSAPNVAYLNRSAILSLVARHAGGGTAVARNQVVVSALSSAALGGLDVLKIGQQVTFGVSSNLGCDVVGAHPVIVENGRAALTDPRDYMLYVPRARTVLAHTYLGQTMLVTFDGGLADGHGATIPQVVTWLQRFHVVSAVNLDGGGSTTFVTSHGVLNHPSDGRERAVSQSLVVVRP